MNTNNMNNMNDMNDNDYDYDLGSFHRPVNTTPQAQVWFDRGLIWTYAFNHEEAVECFDHAIAHDPDCPMAYWGLALALGPNYNKPWESFDEVDLKNSLERAHHALTAAQTKASDGRPVESALIQALQSRYPAATPADLATYNKGYAAAMKSVYHEFSTDLDVVTLYVQALMDLTPWQMWDLRTGQPAPGARTLEAKEILDRAFNQNRAHDHPGLLHMYIHLMEMSSTPESALPLADRLRGLVPDAGHLNHMPTHLDVLCGDYQRTIASNTDAIRADEKFLARKGPVNFYSLYRLHNYHFLIYGAMFAGKSEVALETVDRLERSLPQKVLRLESPPMADWLEAFLGIRMHVLVRFGRWQTIIDLPLPKDQNLYCVTTAMMYYARAIAFAATGQLAQAETAQSQFRHALARVPTTRTLFNNTCIDILAIAAAMLDGELEYRRGNFSGAFDHLRRAIALDDTLPYDEPWGWMQPTRHAYGALLLEQDHVEQAAETYAADLGLDDDTLPRALRHPNNVWALHGYHECLVRLGRAEDKTAVGIKESLKQAVEVADVSIPSSCFCRLNA